MKSTTKGRGRPKVAAARAYTMRHTINLTPAQDKRMREYATENGFIRPTDAMRRLMLKQLESVK